MLIKAITQAVPAYAMSVFKLPMGLCKDIQMAITRFWWSSKQKKRSIHLGLMGKLVSGKLQRRFGVQGFNLL